MAGRASWTIPNGRLGKALEGKQTSQHYDSILMEEHRRKASLESPGNSPRRSPGLLNLKMREGFSDPRCFTGWSAANQSLQITDKPTETKTMKTKILSLTVTLFAAASFSQVALAGPNFPIHRATSGSSARTAGFVMKSDACKDMTCCTTKLVTNAAFGGRGSHSSFKKVRACETSCAVPAKDKQLVCRKGSRA